MRIAKVNMMASMSAGSLSQRIDWLLSVWPKRMSNVASQIVPSVPTRLAQDFASARTYVWRILPKSFRLITTESNELLAVRAKDAIVNSNHNGADSNPVEAVSD